jgi:hypothetical protein
MTRESYNKHKEVINWFYSQPEGVEILYKKSTGDTWYSTELPVWAIDYTYVINDEYSTLRKALADGRTIQRNNSQEDGTPLWQDLQECNFAYFIDDYRIKPKSTFKVGDWVMRSNPILTIHRDIRVSRVVEVTEDNIKINMYNGLRIDYDEEHLQQWKPVTGEWCWFYNTSETLPTKHTHPALYQFKEMYKDKFSPTCGGCLDKCEPFIGTLPQHLKDKHE